MKKYCLTSIVDSDKLDLLADGVGRLSARFDVMIANDSTETYIVQMDAKDGDKLLRNQTYRVQASSKSEAENKARKKCESLGFTPEQIKSARPE